jgi:peptide/nickel transport system substrate-binding protein
MRRLLISLALMAAACKKPQPGSDLPAGPTVVACGPTGCPREMAAAPPHLGGELRVHVEAEPATLCDLVEHDVWSRWIMENQVAETLLFQDPWSGAVRGRLAERFEAAQSALTLHLRPGVKWHDGTAFSAEDVLFTLERARDPAVGADQKSDLDPVSAVQSPDPLTVVIQLSRPAPFLPQALAHLSILPKHLLAGKDLRKAEYGRAPVGTGPFKLAWWKAGQELVLVRNDGYWGDKPRLDRISFRIVRDRQVAWQLYQRGELDVVWRLPPGKPVDDARHDPRLAGHHMLVWTPKAYYFIVYNTRKGALGDPRVRRALTMLTDRGQFIHTAFFGHARPITGPYPPGSASYDESLAPLPFDPKAARALLAEAGVPSLKLTFLLTAGSRTVEQLATLLKEDLARAGIELEVASVDFAVQLDRLRHHAFDVSALQWTMLLEQDNYPLFHSSQAEGGQNYGGYHSASADDLLEQIRRTPDDARRHQLDRALHKRVHEDQPYTFLAQPEVQTMEAPRVHGLLPSTDGFNFAEAWVE